MANKFLKTKNLNVIASAIDNLPQPKDFDFQHSEWRNCVIQAARQKHLTFTHGVAAKLINVYLKSIFVCSGNHEDPRVKALHPPIDKVLLDALYEQNIGDKRKEWQTARKIRWSKLNSEQYKNVISAIQLTIPEGNALWQIEKYWKGFQ